MADGSHECSVCLQPLIDPLALSCGHHFCRLCLIKTTRLAPDGRSCPLCRTTIGIRSLQDHPPAAAQVEAVRAMMGADAYDECLARRQLEVSELMKLADLQLPIFFMYPGTHVGGNVALHLFEPRYKILIRRTWEGNKLFVYCGCRPQPGAPGVIVRIDHAAFLPDGRANIRGQGVEEITLGEMWVEDGTGSLYHTTAHSLAAHTGASTSGSRARHASENAEDDHIALGPPSATHCPCILL